MIVIEEKHNKGLIQLPENYKESAKLKPFKIVSIGPGRWENGIFIKTTHSPKDIVFINGVVMENNFNGAPIFWAREKDVVGKLI
jgi:hypothetical protein